MPLDLSSLKLLLVEDTEPMRKLTMAVLIRLGIKDISTAKDGGEAFQLFMRENHDIVVTDWVMEPEDGLSLIRKIRKSDVSPNKLVPIIITTGYSAWPRVEAARDMGVTEFLVKPFSANDLAKRITHVINNPRNFIESHDFFGPDRRRRKLPGYQGPYRRKVDQDEQGPADIDFV